MTEISIRSELSSLVKKYSYFSTKFAKEYLKERKISFNNITVNQYFYHFKKDGEIYSAGLNWYSGIKNELRLSSENLDELIKDLQRKFPFLDFNCWSIGELKSFFHHLFAKDVTFIYSDSDALGSLSDFFLERNYNVYNNPGKKIVNDYFQIKENTIVLRSSISEEPVNGHYSSTEKILVDLLLENERLNLFGKAEYKRVFYNAICSGRINIAKMLRYSKRREVKNIFLKDILKTENYIKCNQL